MSVVLRNAPRYRRARKKLKSAMLDELRAVLHYNRKYLALLLRSSGRSVFTHRDVRFLADPRVSFASHRGRKIRAYQNKPAKPFGYLEIDLVHHGGDVLAGQFAYTLTATEIATGWTELRVLPNKAGVFVVRAMKSILRGLPFRASHIHSDNGSEFINRPLTQLTRSLGIPFTRSRAFRKNDAPYVESKNWSLVRVYVGYRRYDTRREVAVLRRLARLVALKHNLFIPTMKLEHRQRDGARIQKRHSIEIPARRLLATDRLIRQQQRRLRQLGNDVDYVDLSARLAREQTPLDQVCGSKYAPIKRAKP